MPITRRKLDEPTQEADYCCYVASKHCAFCVWVYGPRLPDTLRILTGWGLTYKGELLTWRKTGAFGTGKTTRKSIENAWLATRGKGLRIRDHGVGQYFETRGSFRKAGRGVCPARAS